MRKKSEPPTILEQIRQHYEQIDLFYYQNRRVIPRPKTTYAAVALWTAGCLGAVAMCLGLNVLISIPAYWEIPVSVVVYGLLAEFSLRFLGIKTVECYQHYAREETRRKCLCVPSCSEYAILCFQKYELVYALLKIRKRLYVTCQGFEYIVDNP